MTSSRHSSCPRGCRGPAVILQRVCLRRTGVPLAIHRGPVVLAPRGARDAQGDAGEPAPRQPAGAALERAPHPPRRRRIPPRLQDGLEGIVSKRLGSRYRSGRSPDWLELKNPEAPAVKREAEEDWGR